MGTLIKISNKNSHLLDKQVDCGAGDHFSAGDWVIQCPGCDTFYHADCWSEYGSKCPRNSYNCWNEKIMVVSFRSLWGRIHKASLWGGIIGLLLGLLTGAVGLAVSANLSWTLFGFVSGGIYSFLALAIFGSTNKIPFSRGLFIFIVGTLVIAVYPKIGLVVGMLFNMLCFVSIGVYFFRARMTVIPRVLIVIMNLLLLFLGTWLTLLIGSGGNLTTGGLYFGVIGIIVGMAVEIETMTA